MTITPLTLPFSAASSSPNEKALKVTCQQPDLARGLSLVSRAVATQSTQPILSCILLSASTGRLRIAATNLDIAIETWIDAQVEAEGALALPAHTLMESIGSLPNETLLLHASARTLSVRCAHNESTIVGKESPDEFPPLAESTEQGATSLHLDASQWKQMITQIAFAASTDDGRPTLKAVFVQLQEATLTVAATDTFRLAESIHPLSERMGTRPSLLIPALGLRELARILPTSGQVTMAVSPQQNQVSFCSERITFVIRLIEGRYPLYQKAIPSGYTTLAVVGTRAFIEAAERVLPFASGALKAARITISESGPLSSGMLTIEASDPDLGSHVSQLEGRIVGPELQMFFPMKFLLDALSRIETAEVAFSVFEHRGILKPVGEMQYTQLVMAASAEAA